MIYFIDVLGTLINESDKNTIYGSKNLIRHFNKHNIPYVVVSNNTKIPSEEFLENLKQKGLEVRSDAYLDPFLALEKVAPKDAVVMYGTESFVNTMKKLGYKENFEKPKAVIIASYDAFSFEDFAKIIEYISAGAKLIAMHATNTYKKGGVTYPGVGAVIKMLESATNTTARVVGKPSRIYYKIAYEKAVCQFGTSSFLERTALMDTGSDPHSLYIDYSEVTMISDDAKGDLENAKELGMKTILVLSGKVDKAENSGVKKGVINYTYNHVGAFLESIENDVE